MLFRSDVDAIGGKRESLVNTLERHLGIPNDEAERQVQDWEARNPDLFEETYERIKPYLYVKPEGR